MKAYGGSGGITHAFLTSTPGYDQLYASTALHLTGEMRPVPIEYEAGWAPQVVGMFWGRKNLLLLPRIEAQFLDRPARSLVTIATEVTRSNKTHICTRLLALTDPHLHSLFLSIDFWSGDSSTSDFGGDRGNRPVLLGAVGWPPLECPVSGAAPLPPLPPSAIVVTTRLRL